MLHICCAPDATVPTRDLRVEGWEPLGYFYGSNIHPEEEYFLRRDAVRALAGHDGFSLTERVYAPSEWFEHASILAEEPERGRRCAVCFELQLRAAAEEAARQGCTHLSSTLSISPHKDAALITRLGGRAVEAWGVKWLDRVWRKGDGFLRSVRISKELGLYRQNYCGCRYSMPLP